MVSKIFSDNKKIYSLGGNLLHLVLGSFSRENPVPSYRITPSRPLASIAKLVCLTAFLLGS